MGYLLDGQTIRAPYDLREENSTQVAQNRTLNGDINRDYFGTNKRRWILTYRNTKKADYDTIKAIHSSYLSTGTTKTFEVTETNYDVDSVSCHVDIEERVFTVRGESYISDFTLVLTEA